MSDKTCCGVYEIISKHWFEPRCFTEANSKAGSTPKKKVIVQAKLTATGQLTTKDPLGLVNPSPKKFSGFTGRT